jgi:hypothetical protein
MGFHSKKQLFLLPLDKEGWVEMITSWHLRFFFLISPHPIPLPQGEREFLRGSYFCSFSDS